MNPESQSFWKLNIYFSCIFQSRDDSLMLYDVTLTFITSTLLESDEAYQHFFWTSFDWNCIPTILFFIPSLKCISTLQLPLINIILISRQISDEKLRSKWCKNDRLVGSFFLQHSIFIFDWWIISFQNIIIANFDTFERTTCYWFVELCEITKKNLHCFSRLRLRLRLESEIKVLNNLHNRWTQRL